MEIENTDASKDSGSISGIYFTEKEMIVIRAFVSGESYKVIHSCYELLA